MHLRPQLSLPRQQLSPPKEASHISQASTTLPLALALPPGEASTPPASALPAQALPLPPWEATTAQATALPPREASTSLASALPSQASTTLPPALALPPGEASTPLASALPVQVLALPPGEASASQATALPPGEASASPATALPPNTREGITPSQANTPTQATSHPYSLRSTQAGQASNTTRASMQGNRHPPTIGQLRLPRRSTPPPR